jgi:predicted transcriptional regulator of viral defense system
VLPLESSPGHQTAEDTWVLATALFSPCYIGGWSAAEYWELTEQIFADTFVVSAANVRSRHPHTAGAKFRIARVDAKDIEGVSAVWRGPVRVSVSDRERTLSDGLTHPEWMGGLRHLLDALRAHRESRAWNAEKLLASVRAHGSGAAAKRLGYLAEMFLRVPTDFINTLLTNRTRGIVKLDPTLPATGSINSRWGLRINAQLSLRDSE